jgi:SNF2 family DNA or RNA helicase
MVGGLQKITKSVSSRRLAEDVLILPENYTKKIYTEFSTLHRTIYEQVITGALKELQDRDGAVEVKKVQQIFPYLIMAIDNPSELMKHFGDKITNPELIANIEKFKFERDHAKLDITMDLLSDYSDEKMILWTSHPSVGFSLEKVLLKKKPFIINGETLVPKGYDRDSWKLKIVEDFQNDPKRNILIAGTQVMNSSLNIVKCHLQTIFDASYNYVELEQLVKRIHRIGQVKNVTTFVPLIDKSMDVLRRKMLEEKDYVNKFFLLSGDKFLTMGQLRTMFSMQGD